MPLHSVNYMLSICVQNILKLSCRCRHRSHYDVLKVAKDSSTKEIKDAFIQLSKKFHPDIKGKTSHTTFLRISEAYNILSRPVSRRKYDAELAVRLQETAWPRKDIDPEPSSSSGGRPTTTGHGRHHRSTSNNPYFYYGIPGIKRLPHVWIVAVCLTTAGLALVAEVFLISTASRKSRDRMQLQSRSGEESLASVRAEAARFGNEIQFQRLAARANLEKALDRVPLPAAVLQQRRDKKRKQSEQQPQSPPQRRHDDNDKTKAAGAGAEEASVGKNGKTSNGKDGGDGVGVHGNGQSKPQDGGAAAVRASSNNKHTAANSNSGNVDKKISANKCAAAATTGKNAKDADVAAKKSAMANDTCPVAISVQKAVLPEKKI